jgi:hypothetical protein
VTRWRSRRLASFFATKLPLRPTLWIASIGNSAKVPGSSAWAESMPLPAIRLRSTPALVQACSASHCGSRRLAM